MKHWRNFDLQLVGIPAGLVCFSVAVLFAISRWPTAGVRTTVPIHQALYAVMGLGLMFALTTFDYRLLRSFAMPLYIGVLGLLGVVLVLGHTTYGAQRWLNVGLLPLQPSEPAKLLLVVALAKFFADREEQIEAKSTVALSLVMVAVPMGMVLIQPDLGTSAVFLAIWLGMALMVGIPNRYLMVLAVSLVAILPVAWQIIGAIKRFHYMQDRLTIFLDPQKDPLGQGYNVIHALITVGSGGFTGQWFRSGTQSSLGLVRVEDKDFIFSVIAEQIGFIGSLVLFAVFIMLFMRIARVSFMAGELYGRLLASGILAMVMFQVFVNIGMNIGLMPVTGVPLPLVSYGGSSLITTLASFGILQSILLRHQKLVFGSA